MRGVLFLVERVTRVAVILAAMSGMFLTGLTRLRALTTALVVVTTLALWGFSVRPSLPVALVAFVVGYLARYAFLFLSFGPGGIAARLRKRFGVAKGFALYEAVTALFFFARGVTFAWLVEGTSLSVSTVGPMAAHGLMAVGTVLALLGTIVNVWATDVVGIDTYYYRDLFSGELLAEIKRTGPYRLFRNPMYGVGQAGAYGLALVSLSPAGLIATLINQLTMYLFNELVERPHVARSAAARSGGAA